MSDTDSDWQHIARTQPYYGVLRDPAFRESQLSDDQRALFFDSGQSHVNMVLDQCTRLFGDNGFTGNALDFGCGVGRLTLPLSRHFTQVVGLDVAPAMLSEAQRYANLLGAQNVRWLLADDALSAIDQMHFDFMLSFIVFQHIPEARGQRILKKLLQRLAPGGIGVFHFKYAQVNPGNRFYTFLSHQLPGGRFLVNFLRGKPLREPHMQMNAYNLNSLMQTIQSEGIHEIHVRLGDHGGHWGVEMYVRRDAETL
ncbi:class I SAM-dependent methyltransferase [Acidithiobacillus concretivorus]|uniref:Class I SAM-dependent methyltransferase n=1 Tax=Acidithiobacillus concretivorus TaxID=3063952 RepID=A0ABS5ZSR7_9PROT|nr:class I SAM-dependent methyltransferase [Acidithiobacillus concretivorus]MBU2739705.1 class I SAM-dependent methyltransferase [Acidithiobacillus concretivorus]